MTVAERLQQTVTRTRVVTATLLLGVFVVAFDLSRKTIFRSAAWNYDYPAHRFMFDGPVLFALILALLLVVVLYGRMLELSRRRYLIMVYGVSLLFGVLAFWALPVTAKSMALTPRTTQTSHDFLYFPAKFLVENGPVAYLDAFHELPTISGKDRRQTARALSELLAQTPFIPFNEYYADYVSGIVTQRHGPVPPLLVAPFMLLLGTTPGAAVTGSYLLAALTPVIAYLAFELYFSERVARFGGLYVAYTPALYIWLRHKSIPYDPIAGLLIAITVYALLRSVRDDDLRWMGAAGLVFSLAALTKISVLPFGLPILVAIAVFEHRSGRAFAIFTASFLIVPVAFLLLGYDFIAQYLFDFARVLSVGGDGSATASSSFVRDLGIAWYNVRLLGPPFLVLTAAGVLQLPKLDPLGRKEVLIGVAFLLAGGPFLLLLGMTTSRHLLGLLTPLVFFGLFAVEELALGERFMQASLAICALTLVVNL